jgi:hypothetical protein
VDLTVVGLITGLLLFAFFTMTVRFFHILHLALGQKGPASAIELRQRKGLSLCKYLPELEARLLVLAAVRKMMNPKHSNRSSLNVQEAHCPGCSALVALRPRSRLLHASIELVSSSPAAVLVDLGG